MTKKLWLKLTSFLLTYIKDPFAEFFVWEEKNDLSDDQNKFEEGLG